MASKGPTEFELSVLAGYKHPARSLTSLRKDLLNINQLVNSLKNYKQTQVNLHLKRSVNLMIILHNVFQLPTLEYALYTRVPTELWPEVATLLFALKLSSSRKDIDEEFYKLLQNMK